MKTIVKGGVIGAVAIMGLSLSACGSDTANANATPELDPAELTAASIDQEAAAAAAAAPQAPAEKPAEGAEKPAQ